MRGKIPYMTVMHHKVFKGPHTAMLAIIWYFLWLGLHHRMTHLSNAAAECILLYVASVKKLVQLRY